MYEYTYPKSSKPDLDKIYNDVINSTMTNKNIAGCLWHESDKILRVYFFDPLSSDDKVILDGIVASA